MSIMYKELTIFGRYVVKVSVGHQSQVADGHLGRTQMSNEASHWSFRPRLKGPPWSQMANKSKFEFDVHLIFYNLMFDYQFQVQLQRNVNYCH